MSTHPNLLDSPGAVFTLPGRQMAIPVAGASRAGAHPMRPTSRGPMPART